MNGISYFLTLSLLLSGCVNIGHMIIGRHWLYFDGEAAKRDLWVRGEEREFLKEHGNPDSYKWELWPSRYGSNVGWWLLDWNNFWVLDMYYGDTVYIFKDHKLYGQRKTWPHEYARMNGHWEPSYHVVDRSTGKVYDIEKW